MVALHKKEMHLKMKVNEIPRIRPVRIAATRQRQLTAITARGMAFLAIPYLSLLSVDRC